MKGLLNLVTDCLEVGGQLLSHVDSLLMSPANPSRLQSLRQSFRIKFHRAKLDLYVQRLETLRSALSFDVANASLALGALLLLRSHSPDSLKMKESIYPSLQHFTSFLTITETSTCSR